MADAADSKSAGSDPVRVQVPSSAPDEQAFLAESLFFIIISEFRQNVFQMYCAENFFRAFTESPVLTCFYIITQ